MSDWLLRKSRSAWLKPSSPPAAAAAGSFLAGSNMLPDGIVPTLAIGATGAGAGGLGCVGAGAGWAGPGWACSHGAGVLTPVVGGVASFGVSATGAAGAVGMRPGGGSTGTVPLAGVMAADHGGGVVSHHAVLPHAKDAATARVRMGLFCNIAQLQFPVVATDRGPYEMPWVEGQRLKRVDGDFKG